MTIDPRPTSAEDAIAELERRYGPPSRAGLGSAVFHAPLPAGERLEQAALARYEEFVGEPWQRFGPEAWLGQWRRVHRRQDGDARDVVAELRAIADRDAASAAGLLLDAVDDAGEARAALSRVFDDPAIAELEAFAIGDGEAMSGLTLAARRDDGLAIVLVLLMD